MCVHVASRSHTGPCPHSTMHFSSPCALHTRPRARVVRSHPRDTWYTPPDPQGGLPWVAGEAMVAPSEAHHSPKARSARAKFHGVHGATDISAMRVCAKNPSLDSRLSTLDTARPRSRVQGQKVAVRQYFAHTHIARLTPPASSPGRAQAQRGHGPTHPPSLCPSLGSKLLALTSLPTREFPCYFS